MASVAEPTLTVGAERARKRRRRRRRHIKFTREGRVFVLVTLGLGFAALNTGNNLMYLLMAFMLSLIVLSGILSELTIKALQVQRRLPERAFAGEPMLIELCVRNQKSRQPSYSVEIEDRAEGEKEARSCYLLKVEADGERCVTYRRVHPTRGVLRFDSFRIGTRYPFSLFHKWRFQDEPGELLVYPKPEPWDVAREVGYHEGEHAGNAAGRGAETRELREFRDRDEMRRIHWRRSAAMGRPVVREMEDEAAELVSLVIDNARPEGDDDFDAQFESTLGRAAYAAQALLQRGASVEIVARGTRSRVLEAGCRPDALWRFLALLPVESGASLPPQQASRPHARRVEVTGRGART